MTKREFMIQYVLNWALAIGDNSMGGQAEAGAATRAWAVIEQYAPRAQHDPDGPPMVRKP